MISPRSMIKGMSPREVSSLLEAFDVCHFLGHKDISTLKDLAKKVTLAHLDSLPSASEEEKEAYKKSQVSAIVAYRDRIFASTNVHLSLQDSRDKLEQYK